ncbi:MAG: hypothetical protein Q4A32_01545 [Lachnospiraceae bacterium]|nr:hypothetical protein [Lachnospiraceae bacterium]
MSRNLTWSTDDNETMAKKTSDKLTGSGGDFSGNFVHEMRSDLEEGVKRRWSGI